MQVEFIGDELRTGDHWLIPARTLTGNVEWPQAGGEPLFERRHGTAHHYAPLAILDFDGTTWTIRHDCRRLFPPTTELIQLHYAGGGGQDAVPDPDPARPGRFLPLAEPLRVRVTNGEWPVQGRRRRLPGRHQRRLHARGTADRRRRARHGARR